MLTLIELFQVFHSDYFSGWEEKELQHVLDNCENDSEAANPNAFCSGFLSFRGKPKQEGVQVEDLDIRSDLEKIQPEVIDTQATISQEEVTNIPDLPEGSCTGTLLPASTAPTSPTAPTASLSGNSNLIVNISQPLLRDHHLCCQGQDQEDS